MIEVKEGARMGQGRDDVSGADSPEVLEQEVEELRENVTEVIGKLDRRRHEVFDWRIQLKRNAVPLALTALGFIVFVAGTAGLSAWRRRRRDRPLARARRMRAAFSRMVAHPELIAQPRPSISNRALAAAVSAVAGRVAEVVSGRVLAPLEPR
jgi:hypothetical protein